mgnify:CR=1 FL=1
MVRILATDIDPHRLTEAVLTAAEETDTDLSWAEALFASPEGWAYILMAEGVVELDPTNPEHWTWVMLADDGSYVLEANI